MGNDIPHPQFQNVKASGHPSLAEKYQMRQPFPSTPEMTKPTLSPYSKVTPTHHKTNTLKQKNDEPIYLIQEPHINLEHKNPDLKASLSGSPVSSQGDTSVQTHLTNHLYPSNRKYFNKTQYPPQLDKGKYTLSGSTPQSQP